MRALSLTQANRCETALHPTCRCRCHGTCHGVRRFTLVNQTIPPEFFEKLEETDPHYVKDAVLKAEKLARKKGVV